MRLAKPRACQTMILAKPRACQTMILAKPRACQTMILAKRSRTCQSTLSTGQGQTNPVLARKMELIRLTQKYQVPGMRLNNDLE